MNTTKLRLRYHSQHETGFGVLPHHQSCAGKNDHQTLKTKFTDFPLKIENMSPSSQSKLNWLIAVPSLQSYHSTEKPMSFKLRRFTKWIAPATTEKIGYVFTNGLLLGHQLWLMYLQT